MVNGSPTENLQEKVNKLISCLGDDVSSQVVVTGCERLKQRNPAYKPLVKIAFASLEQKIMVLRAKHNLEQHMEFRNVWLRGAKDHVERLIDINFNTVLKMIPAGNDYKVSGSGRIIKKQAVNSGNADTEEQHASPHGRQDTYGTPKRCTYDGQTGWSSIHWITLCKKRKRTWLPSWR